MSASETANKHLLGFAFLMMKAHHEQAYNSHVMHSHYQFNCCENIIKSCACFKITSSSMNFNFAHTIYVFNNIHLLFFSVLYQTIYKSVLLFGFDMCICYVQF